MKIGNYADKSKSIEIATTEEDDSILSFQGDATISTKNRDSGEKSTVANINQHGAVDFVQRPRVADEELALKSETGVDITTTHRTIVDNVTSIVVLCPVQHMVNVLYSIENAGAREVGTLTITEHLGNYNVTAEQHANTGYFADVEFTANESNGSLLLNVVGSGAGLITDFKYRVNTINTLYL